MSQEGVSNLLSYLMDSQHMQDILGRRRAATLNRFDLTPWEITHIQNCLISVKPSAPHTDQLKILASCLTSKPRDHFKPPPLFTDLSDPSV